MGDMLSQDEIAALLGGMNIGGDPPDGSAGEISDLDSALMADAAGDAAVEQLDEAYTTAPEDSPPIDRGEVYASDAVQDLERLTGEEKDVLGEIGNISMGTAATTLFALLGQRVMITTPRVKTIHWKDLSVGYERPCVGVRVAYTEGLRGSNVMILRDRDVKIITSLMMGGDGTGPEVDEPINDIDLSAIAEAMNQMSGSSSTSLSSLVKMRIDIDTPVAFILDFNSNNFMDDLGLESDEMTCISFRMEIGTLIDSEIMQVVPLEFALEMVRIMKGELGFPKAEGENVGAPASTKSTAPPTSVAYAAPPEPAPQAPPPQPVYEAPPPQPVYQAPPEQYAPPPQQYYAPPPQYYAPPPQPLPPPPQVNAQPAQFQPFDYTDILQQKENIAIIREVPLEVSVELGRTTKKIKEILAFSPGEVIELDKLAGEPIDIMVNGKLVAKGEVVVIDENFGVRITDTVSAESLI